MTLSNKPISADLLWSNDVLYCTDAAALTRYLSEETLTSIKSSPTRTFSPSDLCLEAGCTVHQHASPGAKQEAGIKHAIGLTFTLPCQFHLNAYGQGLRKLGKHLTFLF